MSVDADNPLTRMQRAFYAQESARWSPEDRDPVVGSFDAHNAWADWELLFEGIDTAGMIGLDFGCGPGRAMVLYADRFARLDGADIDPGNLANAERWCVRNGVAPGRLWLCNGVDLAAIPTAGYDLVMSTITLQHIPVHAIRQGYFREFARVLRPGGVLTAQMGFGWRPDAADYYEDRYDAPYGGMDVAVTAWARLAASLEEAGFDRDTFRHRRRVSGPGDRHPEWIFFQARTPKE